MTRPRAGMAVLIVCATVAVVLLAVNIATAVWVVVLFN